MSAHSLYKTCENLQAYLLLKVYQEIQETIDELTFNSINMVFDFMWLLTAASPMFWMSKSFTQTLHLA